MTKDGWNDDRQGRNGSVVRGAVLAEVRAWRAFMTLAEENRVSAQAMFTGLVAQYLALQGRSLADQAFDPSNGSKRA